MPYSYDHGGHRHHSYLWYTYQESIPAPAVQSWGERDSVLLVEAIRTRILVIDFSELWGDVAYWRYVERKSMFTEVLD